MGVGGGWLLSTDHFCPVERRDDELTLVPWEQQAQEVLDQEDPKIIARYREFPKADLLEYADRDRLAWAILILDYDWRP